MIKNSNVWAVVCVVLAWTLTPFSSKDFWAWFSDTAREHLHVSLILLFALLCALIYRLKRAFIKKWPRKELADASDSPFGAAGDVSLSTNNAIRKAMDASIPRSKVIEVVIPTSLPQDEVDVLKIFKFQHVKTLPLLEIGQHLGAGVLETRKIVDRMEMQGLVEWDRRGRGQPVTLTPMGNTWLDDQRR